MKDFVFSEWLYKNFESLPRCKDDFFLKLWQNGRMRYSGNSGVFDTIDELSARLVCATLHNRRRILVILPDSETKRPAALFASALIMSSIDLIEANKGEGCVLYFGSKIGIRSHLSNISVGNLQLSEVFSQTYGQKIFSSTQSRRLPHVICIYSPLDPLSLVSIYSPRWIAIDCGDSASIPWINQLLSYLKTRNIPLIAWSSNPLSSIKKEFASIEADIFKWPPLLLHPQLESRKNNDVADVLCAFSESCQSITIVPCLLASQEAETTSDYLSNAQRLLAEGMSKSIGRMEKDALLVGWRYFRALERLIIPLDLFEAEFMHYWGVKSINQIKGAFERFVSAVASTSSIIIENLEGAKHCLDSTLKVFQKVNSPRWEALIELCLEEISKDNARILVFSGPAQKSMFIYALLARENTSEKHLADMRVFLLTFKEATALLEDSRLQKTPSTEDLEIVESNINPPHAKNLNFIHVTLPSQYQSEKMVPFLGLRKFEILIYPYQLNALSRKITEWGNDLDIDIPVLVSTFSNKSHGETANITLEKRTITRMSNARTIAGRPLLKAPTAEIKPIWEPRADVEEVAFLFSNKDDETSLEDHNLLLGDEEEVSSKDALVEKVLEIYFADGWRGLFDLNSKLNIVKSTSHGNEIELCYVQALRKGDRVLYIYGQKRQSLYDLVLSRVHSHPSIEIHLVLMRQWQTEIKQDFIRWLQNGKVLEDIYSQMRGLGTHLTSPSQLRSWILGLTMRPQDEEDLKRIAEILGMPFTAEHYKRIHKACGRIHGLHISLSRRLNSWIQRGASKTELHNEIIDETTGLSFGDVRDSLVLLNVESISEKAGPFDKSSLNRIERKFESE